VVCSFGLGLFNPGNSGGIRGRKEERTMGKSIILGYREKGELPSGLARIVVK